MKHPAIVLVLASLAASSPAAAQYNGVPQSGMMTKGDRPAGITPAELAKVDFEQRLGQQVPLDLSFTDQDGRPARLSQYFQGKPVVLSLVYYECPMLCVQALNGLVKSMKALTLEPGKDYQVVTVSFNPRETPRQATEKRDHYLSILQRPSGARGVALPDGRGDADPDARRLGGFHYVYDEQTKQFAHPTGIVVLTPEGRTSKYIYGLDYGPRDLRLALVEAANHEIGTPVDRLLLYCFHYDPAQGKYGLVVMNVMRLAGAVTVFSVGAFILIMWRREKREQKVKN